MAEESRSSPTESQDAKIEIGDVGRDISGTIAGRDVILHIYNYPAESLPTPPQPAPTDETIPDNPYRGLFAFRPEHAHLFFGRETFTEKLLQATDSRPFVAVLGASGSGKSSVVFAGLVPALDATGQWLFTTFRPGSDPFLGLASALVPLYETELSKTKQMVATRELATNLRQGKLPLSDVLNLIHQTHPDQRLLVIADQFEELYTLCRDLDARHRFLDTLLQSLNLPISQSPNLLILTLRADFLGQALTYRPLADALQDADLKLGPMTHAEMMAAIEEPAELQGVQFEAKLVDRLLDDVGGKEGSLALLEFTLTELWQYQSQRTLTHVAYEEIGEVEGALSRHADKAYQRLLPAEQKQARRIFVQLVNPGAGTEDTRRLASRTELETDWPLVAKLANERLVVTNQVENEQDTVEVVHEVLIRHWGQLQVWMAEDRTFRAWQDRLRFAQRQWQVSQQDEGALLRGAPLAEAEGWLAERPADLGQAEKDYINASLERRRKQERRRRLAFAGAIAAAVVMAVLAVFSIFQWQEANQQRVTARAAEAEAIAERNSAATSEAGAIQQEAVADAERATAQAESTRAIQAEETAVAESARAEAKQLEAEQQANIALSRQLAIQSANELSRSNYELALLLAIEAGYKANTIEAHNALHQVLAHPGRSLLILSGTMGRLERSWAPNGRFIQIRQMGRQVFGSTKVYDVKTGERTLTFVGDSGWWNSDGSQLLTTDHGIGWIWNTETGENLGVLLGHSAGIEKVVWNNNSSRILTASPDNTIRMWDVKSGSELLVLNHTGQFYWHMSWNSDESRILTVSDSGLAKIWDANTGEELFQIPVDTSQYGSVEMAYWSKDDSRVLMLGEDNTVKVWDTTTGKVLVTLAGHTRGIAQVSWGRDESRILTASYDGTARVWDAETGNELLILDHPRGLYTARFNADESRIMTSGNNDTTVVWDTNSGQQLLTIPGIRAAWSTDESHILTSGDSGYLWLWDAETGDKLVTLYEQLVTSWPSVAWNADESLILSAEGNDGRVWDTSVGEELPTLSGHTDTVHQAILSNDEKRILTASADGTARVWDANTGSELLTLSGHKAAVHQAVWNKDESRILTASGDGTARAWDANTGAEILTLTGHNDWLAQAIWNADESRVLTAGADGTARVWDATTGVELLTLSHPQRENQGELVDDVIYQAIWNADESRILTASSEVAKVWDAQTGTELLALSKELGSYRMRQALWNADESLILAVGTVWDADTGVPVTPPLKPGSRSYSSIVQASWSADETNILTASFDGFARVWDVKTGSETLIISGHLGDPLWQAVWNANESKILTASHDGTARVWDAKTGAELLTLPGHTAGVTQAIWNADESRIITASDDGTVRQYYTRLDDLLTAACQCTPRNMSLEEWAQFMGDELYRATCPNQSLDPSIKQPLIDEARELAQINFNFGVDIAPEETIDLEGAIAKYKEALELDPNLDLDPEEEAKHQAVQSLLHLATNVARSGNNVEKAVTLFEQAMQLYPDLGIDPAAVVNRIVVPQLVAKGRKLVERGNTEGAMIQFQKALELDPNLNLDPEVEIQRGLALQLVAEGSKLATGGNIEAAIIQFRKALELDPSLDLDPKLKAQELEASGLVQKGIDQAKGGNLEEALAYIEDAQKLSPAIEISASPWNKLCWYGSLWGYAADVIKACEQTVRLAPDNGGYRDSRGVARALTGDYEGAIEDFEFFVAWAKESVVYERHVSKREAWIVELKAGRNPFDEATLEELRNE